MKIHDAAFVKGAVRWEHLPEDGVPEVAFLGRSNVGKSSLVNMLVGRRMLARTSRQPGKTREINFYRVNDRFYLVDLPGLGYAKVPRTMRETWTRFIERYLQERAPLRLVVHLVDSRHPPTPIDHEVMAFMAASPARYIVALTKVDKLSKAAAQRSRNVALASLAEHGLEIPIVLTSAEKGDGKADLWRLVGEALEG